MRMRCLINEQKTSAFARCLLAKQAASKMEWCRHAGAGQHTARFGCGEEICFAVWARQMAAICADSIAVLERALRQSDTRWTQASRLSLHVRRYNSARAMRSS